ncbi:MAG: hypothetical protein QF780_03975 [Candidatus Marinimicrobia bacterium]|nr:hypothetical protein [Candidatus Neomarinimicrobiota bacterium]
MNDEKNIDKVNYYYMPRVLFLFLRFDMVVSSIMLSAGKKIISLIFWMGLAAGTVIILDSIFTIPDEISGILYFLSIGIAASSVLNHYR